MLSEVGIDICFVTPCAGAEKSLVTSLTDARPWEC